MRNLFMGATLAAILPLGVGMTSAATAGEGIDLAVTLGYDPTPGASVVPYWLIALAIIIAVELHVLIGNRGLATQKYLTTPGPSGVIHAGFLLAIVLYLNAAFVL